MGASEQGSDESIGKAACTAISWVGGEGKARGRKTRSRLLQQQPRQEAIEARTRVVTVGVEREKQMRETLGRKK